jgi:hypothetical protein
MSWLFSQVLVEEYLGDISSDGEQSVPSSGNPIQQAYCAPDKMTVFSRLSRFGMTYKPLTEDRGEALLMSYLEAFLAKTLAQPGGGQELTESDQECGKKWHGSFTKYDHDTYSWKTHQCSLLGGLEPFSETWPRWGLMRDGECWEQQTLAHLTRETEYGLWPTPTVCGNYNQKGMSKSSGDGLATAVKMWPTPRTRGMCGGTGHKQMLIQKLGEEEGTEMFNGGKLNPSWVEWLMGWPLGWTDLKPLETDKFQKWQDEHGSC